MLVPGIKSRPVYAGLHADAHARWNILCAQGAGALTLEAMLASAPGGFLTKSVCLYTAADAASLQHENRLATIGFDAFWQGPTTATLLVQLDHVLNNAVMGTRLYVAGIEGFIGEVMRLGMQHGIDPRSIQTEHAGSIRRRVQCVHCKGITDDVTTQPARCAHCGLMLLVRDHFSRRIGAFQGVCIDAEAPGQIPPAEVAFP
jgi:dimethylamine monooxygenase subunit C